MASQSITGKAVVFEPEADCLKAIREDRMAEGMVVVIRNEAPKGGPGLEGCRAGLDKR